MHYFCKQCNSIYALTSHKWRCDCGGLLHIDYEKKKINFSTTAISSNHSLWKYIDSLPFEKEDVWRDITLGEGDTPIIQLSENLFAKAEYYMPTLSFKDRGAAVLMAMAKKLKAERVVADSSGNAGTAISAYGARAGIQCDIFVPASTSSSKMKQIEAHGAVIHKIPGTREDTAKAAIDMVEKTGAFYASHIYNPLFWEGTKTYVFEIYEQMNGKLPDVFIIPVGNGTLLLGAYIAFKELLDNKQIEKFPKIVAVQAEACAPIAEAFATGKNEVAPVDSKGTEAEGIAVAQPARGTEIMQAIRATNGDVITVTEESITEARRKLALQGIYVEVTAAVNYAGYLTYLKKDPGLEEKRTILPLCGAGLKSH